MDIITSRALIDTLGEQNLRNLEYRVIDWVRVKGRSEPIELIEILNHLDKTSIQTRLRNEVIIEQAIIARRERAFDRAIALLLSLELDNESYHADEDPLIQHHINTLQQLKQNPPDAQWDGALDI